MLVATLGEWGFDAFECEAEGEGGDLVLSAYGSYSTTDPSSVEEALKPLSGLVLWQRWAEPLPQVNWNERWEAAFEPVRMGRLLGLRAPFHEPMTEVGLELVVMPRMSFGTGHHETTLQMCWWMLGAPPPGSEPAADALTVEGKVLPWPSASIDPGNPPSAFTSLKGLKVLDMGCGTGILAILAARLGASEVVGIDVESWSAENAAENAQRNGVSGQWICGDAQVLQEWSSEDRRFDLVLANINRNVLLEDMEAYVALLPSGGQLWLSGFYESDTEVLRQKAGQLGLVGLASARLNHWCTLLFRK